ncbi:hypothetical protein ACFL3L_01070 [Candidatus Neomarinimicrobiota bacterium]
MAKPRPPVIISNGAMLNTFRARIIDVLALKKEQEPDKDQMLRILYGEDGEDNGIVTKVKYDKYAKPFVYWRTSDSDDKEFKHKKDKSMYDEIYWKGDEEDL